jgi:hypothetical protein
VLRVLNAMAAVAVVIASMLIFSGHAYAHERRMVGPYQFVVGWLNEPAYVGQLNSLDLRISDTRVRGGADQPSGGSPVTGLEKTLTADVAAGGLAPFKLEVTARFGTAGAYNGVVTPTATGTYTFHITGKIDTTSIDEKFTSGPNTFGDIEDMAAVQYPTKVPVADDLGKKLDAIQSGVDQTRLIALIALALGVGLLGLRFMPGRRS